jgi:hypothetical protein
MEELKQLSKQLPAAQKSVHEVFLKTILSKEGKCWSEFYKYVKGGNEIGKIFLPSKTIMDGSLQIRYIRPIRLIHIIRQDLVARAIFRTRSAKTQANCSLLILKSLGGGLERSGKTNQ